MATFTSDADLNIRWYGNELSGPAGTVHRIPDALQDEFDATFGERISGLTWVSTDETGDNAPPYAQSDVTGLTAALAAKVAIAGATMTGPLQAPVFEAKGRPWFDVKAYGAVGDGTTDDATAFGLAITAASAGGIVHIPAGTYRMATPLDITSGVTLAGAGPSVTVIKIDHTSYGIKAAGALSSSASLAADRALGDLFINVGASSSLFAAGDTYFLRDEGTALVTGHKRAELGTVLAVSGGLVSVAGRIMDVYTTANSAVVYKVNPVRGVVIRDLGMVNTRYATATTQGTNPLIQFDFVRDGVVENCRLYENNGPGVSLRNTFGARVQNCLIEDLRDDTPNGVYGYGVTVGFAARDTTIVNTVFRRCRHGVTTDTSASGLTPDYGVQRGVSVTGCVASECSGAAFDSHEDSEGVTYTACTVSGSQGAGIQVRGHHTVISGCVIRDVSGNGIYIDSDSFQTFITGTIVANVFSDSVGSGHAIGITGNDEVGINGCLLADCAGTGISVGGANVLGITITGNGIYGNGLDGINFSVNYTGSIIGNVIKSNLRYGLRFESGVSGFNGATVLGNIIQSNTSANYSNAGTLVPTTFGNSGAASGPGFFQRMTVSTGSVASSATADVVVTWPVTFGDTNYTVLTDCVESTGALEVRAIKTKSNGSVTVTVKNNDAAAARTGTINAIAIHD